MGMMEKKSVDLRVAIISDLHLGFTVHINENYYGLGQIGDQDKWWEYALRYLPKNARVADLCTGSGCIGIALAHYRPDITVTAVDLFPETARMAEKNACRLGVADRVAVIVGDVTKEIFPPGETFDAIVSNPPYLTIEEMQSIMNHHY